jgi:aquaporin TIP
MSASFLQIIQKLAKPEPNLAIKLFAEMSATMVFHFIGSLSPTPYANGIALIVLVYYTAKISGAHLNPALSLTFTLLGYTNPIEMLAYWIAQVTGCIIGAAWIKLLAPHGWNDIGCFYPNPALTNSLIVGWEAFCTFTFMLPIFTVVWYTIHKTGYGNTGPLIVGLSLVASAYAAGPFTGAALNPARVLGSLIVFQCSGTQALYYILGELLGASLVPLCVIPFYGINEDAWWLKILPDKPKVWFEEHQHRVRNSKEYTIPAFFSNYPDGNTPRNTGTPQPKNSGPLPRLRISIESPGTDLSAV